MIGSSNKVVFSFLAQFILAALPALADNKISPRLIQSWSIPANNHVSGPPTMGQLGNEQETAPGQVFLGLSALQKAGPNQVYALVDNGFGTQSNSCDFIARIYTLSLPSEGGEARIETFIDLKDPDFHFGSLLIAEDPDKRCPLSSSAAPLLKQYISTQRVLTGADIDPESMVLLPNGEFLIGDEFGPYLFRFSSEGKLLGNPLSLKIPSQYCQTKNCIARSPQFSRKHHQSVNLPASKGLEGLALSPDGKQVMALLEGPLNNMPQDQLLLIEYSVRTLSPTGRHFIYPLSAPFSPNNSEESHKIGAISFLNQNTLAIIETDGHQREQAKFKRIFSVDLENAQSGDIMQKHLLIDLLKIPILGKGKLVNKKIIKKAQTYSFPFTTIESLLLYDNKQLMIANDNNFPTLAGRGRNPARSEDTEIILLQFD